MEGELTRTEEEFTRRLVEFGLSEKEAQTYVHLLKPGPETSSSLAKSLHSYPKDIHGTLGSLIDKGMVRGSLDAIAVYTAVEVRTALPAALEKLESE
jgi:sugar-specific transcriptional regulator TrmB